MFKKRMLFGEEISAAVLSGDNMRLQVSGTFYKVPNGAETPLQNGNTIIERCEDGSLVITTEHLIPFTTNDDQIVEMADKILVDMEKTMGLETGTYLTSSGWWVGSNKPLAIDKAYRMINRDAVKANCVTKEDIRNFLLKHGEKYQSLLYVLDNEHYSDEDIENGFIFAECEPICDKPADAWEIQRIDLFAELGIPGFPSTDEEAGQRARSVGVPLITDLFPVISQNQFIDTPENRQQVKEYYFTNQVGSD